MISATVSFGNDKLFYDGASPALEYNSDVQKTDESGNPKWKLRALWRGENSRRTETLTVTVPLAQNPDDVIAPFTPIAFKNPRVMTGENNGRVWVSFAADGIANVKGKE